MKIGSPSDLEQDATADDYWVAALRPRLANIDKIKNRWRLQNALEREAEAMQKAMSILRTRYNAASSISCFPPELLPRVFSFSAVQEPPGKCDIWHSPSISSSALGWFKVTHVCSYWRAAALQEPNLWTDVNYSLGLRWAGLMLARSKAAPISVSSDDCQYPDRTLFEHFFHLSHLDLREVFPEVIASCNAPAPLMKSLLLGSRDFSLLPVDAFGNHAPSLRKIVLCDVHLSYSSLLLTNLTHLEIRWSHPYLDRPYLPSKQLNANNLRVDLLMGSLSRMPALCTLILHNCIPFPDRNLSSTSHLTPRLGLMHLKTLWIVGAAAQCAVLMDHLAFPQVCKLKMELRDPDTQPGDVLPGLRAHLLGRTSTTFDKHIPLTFTVLAISCKQRIRAWRHDDSTSCEPTQYARIPEGEPDIDILPHGGTQTIQDICDLLPLEDLRVLWKEQGYRTSWTTQQWLTILGRCINLEHLYLDGDGDILEICKARPTLDIGPETMNSLENAKASRGKLQSLALDGIHFRSNISAYIPGLDEILAEWLVFMNIPRLRISWCRIDIRQLLRLEKVIQVEKTRCRVFHWDETSCETRSDDYSET